MSDFVLREILGSKMYLLANDPGISRSLIRSGIREPNTVQVIQKIVKPGMTVIDVGANLGYYALLESMLVGPNGKVYAIEPVEENYRVLCENIRLNNCRNIEVFPLAVGDKAGEQEIFLSKHSNRGTMIDLNGASEFYRQRMSEIGKEKATVNTVTLDNFIREHGIKAADLVRMDVEGYEPQVIGGMVETLKTLSPKLLIEVHYAHFDDPGVIDNMLVKLYKAGYRITKVAARRAKRSTLKAERANKQCPNVLLEKKGNIHILVDAPVDGIASGAEKAMLHLIQGLKKRGFKAEVLDQAAPKPKKRYKEADVIFTQASGMPRVISYARAKPVVYYMHNDYRVNTFPVYRGLKEEHINLLILNANWVKERLSWNGEVIVVHPPIDAAKFKTTPGEHITLVNLTEKKGVCTFKSIAEKMPDRRFLGVQGGWGVQKPPELANVTVIPKTPNIRDDVYAKTKILLMPSQYVGPTEEWNWTESWGMVGVEAMCSGIPVIAHPTPGLLESLSYAGIFIDREDINGWVEAIKRLDDPEVYRKHSELALKRAAELDPNPQIDRLADLIRERIWHWTYL